MVQPSLSLIPHYIYPLSAPQPSEAYPVARKYSTSLPLETGNLKNKHLYEKTNDEKQNEKTNDEKTNASK